MDQNRSNVHSLTNGRTKKEGRNRFLYQSRAIRPSSPADIEHSNCKTSMSRLRLLLLAAALALAAGSSHGFEFHEATLDAIHLGFKNGSLTSTALVRFYLSQISRLNHLVHAVIEVNPDALRQAARADAERRSCGPCRRCGGGLHGIPVLLKDNIATRDRLNTTAGSLALLGSVVRREAGVVRRLRRAGAVVLSKANMEEWANFRNLEGLGGWSARGGQGRVSVSITQFMAATIFFFGINCRKFLSSNANQIF